MPRPLLFLLLSIISVSVWAEPSRKAWVSFEIPQARESVVVKAIEAKGVTTIAWSNALVDISVFQGTEARPLATLNQTLTPSDPRWDPWLKGLDTVFHPHPGVARIWVEADRRGEASAAMGGHEAEKGPVPPRGVTGWMIIAAALFYFGLRLFGQGWPDFKAGVRVWVWLPSVAVAVLVGGLMVWGGPSGPVSGGRASSLVAWTRHRWYQEALSYGATWDDWADGKAWSYSEVERRNGKLVEDKASLPAADTAWADAAFDALDPHQAARIFGIGNS
jgi:hypothetical protein